MLEFGKELELMCVELRNKKDGSGQYHMVTVLGDNGKTIDLKYDGQPIDWSKFQPRKKYFFTFHYVSGKYSYCNIISIA